MYLSYPSPSPSRPPVPLRSLHHCRHLALMATADRNVRLSLSLSCNPMRPLRPSSLFLSTAFLLFLWFSRVSLCTSPSSVTQQRCVHLHASSCRSLRTSPFTLDRSFLSSLSPFYLIFLVLLIFFLVLFLRALSPSSVTNHRGHPAAPSPPPSTEPPLVLGAFLTSRLLH